MGPPDAVLQGALDDWRDDKTKSIYGTAYWNEMGPCLILPNDYLDRIVQCAHEFKICDVDDLVKETRWPLAAKYGPEVIDLIRRHGPQPPANPPLATTAQLPNRTVGAAGDQQGQREKTRNKCSSCGQAGHNARNRLCPQHPSRSNLNSSSRSDAGSSSKENQPAQQDHSAHSEAVMPLTRTPAPQLVFPIPPSVFYGNPC
ncbi:hypothetical protein PC9H_008448 [Pleurotus ostreatus]|uniref:Zinc knuckle domain-containing protein n=1 Tax=Pleurotus ostreatus TaxID=5322 RepID=A0A8H6ZR45_PLEOS|nr:uncharacterized protein PC9H_008448 [Pleurotus ostreatus]KAF7426082.1 hypothetical protein PC9H_008448 [Pleurotus ostreatus]KAJ8693518.1 hypothetical protein PTI98_008505 [Pleurotus ostreatus]